MLTLAYSLFWVNFMYGIAVKFGLLHREKFKFLHHLIYFFVMLSLFITITFEIFYEKWLNTFLLTIVFLLLLSMTRFSGKKSSHWQYAILCNLVYTIIFIYLITSHGTV